MSDIEQVILKLKESAEQNGIYFYDACQSNEIENLLRESFTILQTHIPQDYVKLFKLTNGLGTQRGILYNVSDFVEQNYRLWFCESKAEATLTGTVISFSEKQQRGIPTYAWLGCYGNMDSYIFDFASQRFAVTTLGDETEVWNSYSNLADLLLYLTKENNAD